MIHQNEFCVRPMSSATRLPEQPRAYCPNAAVIGLYNLNAKKVINKATNTNYQIVRTSPHSQVQTSWTCGFDQQLFNSNHIWTPGTHIEKLQNLLDNNTPHLSNRRGGCWHDLRRRHRCPTITVRQGVDQSEAVGLQTFKQLKGPRVLPTSDKGHCNRFLTCLT